jgi:serine/threonine protein kinase
MVERLRREREILARLDHPSIARLIDVGDDPDGLPYVVMEYVDGEPIDAYCDRAGLGLRERLELLEAVCAAVDVAHRSLVVHRDLKPSNVLVTRGGEPKLVDFGIARRLDDEDATLGTSRLLTPRWASPEQLRGGPVTTAADIYALGLLLCHLLTGRLPYRSSTATLPLLAREIVEETPLQPSSLLSVNEASADEASASAGRFFPAPISHGGCAATSTRSSCARWPRSRMPAIGPPPTCGVTSMAFRSKRAFRCRVCGCAS